MISTFLGVTYYFLVNLDYIVGIKTTIHLQFRIYQKGRRLSHSSLAMNLVGIKSR